MILKYRGYTIEKERDGSWSIYHPALHYVAGGFKSSNEAAADLDYRLS